MGIFDYYTRICTKGRNRQRCVSCICRTIPQYDIGKENTESIAAYLENGTEDDETENLQKVTIHSDAEHLTWGNCVRRSKEKSAEVLRKLAVII